MALLLGTLVVALDNTIIGVVVPRITTVFNEVKDIGWYGSSYLITVTALQPIFGNFYKLFHVKVLYITSVVILESNALNPANSCLLADAFLLVGSILCASASSSPIFIFGRAIVGVGAAGIFQGALCVTGFIAPVEKRPMYLGIVISVYGFAICFGPILGGVFTDGPSWRWCFWVFVHSRQLQNPSVADLTIAETSQLEPWPASWSSYF